MPTAARPTLSDVAKHAGVSRTTASFVVNGRTDMRISPDATQRVEAAVVALGYRPNAVAMALRNQTTHTIAMMSDSIATNEYGGQFVRGVLEAAQEYQRLVVISETNSVPDVESIAIDNLVDRQVDGFIYATEAFRKVHLPDQLRKHPCILLNCIDASGNLPSVLADEVAAGMLAFEALTETTDLKNTFILGKDDKTMYSSVRRRMGIKSAARAHGMPMPKTIDCNWWPEAAHDALSLHLASGKPLSALICMNDRIAMGAYQALAHAGRSPGADISIVSFDDSLLSAWLRPGLTSVSLPQRQLGKTAVELLLGDHFRRNPQPQVKLPKETLMSPRVTMRSSVVPAF